MRFIWTGLTTALMVAGIALISCGVDGRTVWMGGIGGASVGAAVGIFAVDRIAARFTYVGVGNTGISRVAGQPWSGISRDGLLGTRLPNLTEQCGTLTSGDAFLLWTDGVPERLSRQYLAHNSRQGAQQIAREIVRTLAKGHDDAGCIVFRWL